jgi:hypothetical protein
MHTANSQISPRLLQLIGSTPLNLGLCFNITTSEIRPTRSVY